MAQTNRSSTTQVDVVRGRPIGCYLSGRDGPSYSMLWSTKKDVFVSDAGTCLWVEFPTIDIAEAEFSRTLFAGNSSGCIKRRPFKDTAAIRYPPDARARGDWPSEQLRSVLLALGFVTAPNTGRILMLHAA